MKAVVSVRLPEPFYVTTEHMEPVEIAVDSTIAIVHPPVRSVAAETGALTLTEAVRQLQPAPDPSTTDSVKINGQSTIESDLMVLEFNCESFDRTSGLVTTDPTLELITAIVNAWLIRYRTVMNAPYVRLLQPGTFISAIRYANDDGTELAPDPALVRAKIGLAVTTGPRCAVSSEGWEFLASRGPDWQPATWSLLLVDAADLLSTGAGPCIVLAFAAVEVRLTTALPILAEQSGAGAADVVAWFMSEARDPDKLPPVTERADSLFKLLSGRSLADEPELWQSFQRLRRARNAFVHTGVAVVGKGKPMDRSEAQKLLISARQIVDWVEAQLPPESRTETFTPTTEIAVTSPIVKV